MSIKIQCPLCRRKYCADDLYIGERFHCLCGAIVEVPGKNAFTQQRKKPSDKPRPVSQIAEKTPSGKSPKTSPKTKAADSDAARPEKRALTIYGLLAIFFGTSGCLAALACFALLGSAFFSPVFGSRQNDLEALGIAACVFIAAFTLAAFFRLADLALRRSDTRFFF